MGFIGISSELVVKSGITSHSISVANIAVFSTKR